MLFSQEKIKIPHSAFHSRVDAFLKQKRMACKAKFPMLDTFPHGSPLGGFGTGTFSRTARGEFAVWHLFSGVHIYEPQPFCNFAIYQKNGSKKKSYVLHNNPGGLVKTWTPLPNNKMVDYYAQYPKSWYVYNDDPVKVTIEQFSPILPYNYKETAYPAACFLVQLENKKNNPVEASILLSWENMIGYSYKAKDKNKGITNFQFDKQKAKRTNTRVEVYEYKGVVFSGEVKNEEDESLKGEFCIAAKEVVGTKIHFCSSFDAASDGHEIWETFSKNGTLKDSVRTDPGLKAGAFAVKAELNPNQVLQIPIVITWDIPYCNQNRTPKYYTKYFDKAGNNSFALAKEVLQRMDEFSKSIDQWHSSLLKQNIPEKLVGSMFNELYYLADGGTIWDASTGNFTYLECFDYYFYETLDVRYYGSFPLVLFWPEIEKNIMREYIKSIYLEDVNKVDYHASASTSDKNSLAGDQKQQFIQRDQRKRKFTAPHDLGSPFEDVWNKVNAYTWQNANRWKDLNSKFVLMIYRAYYYSGKKDRDFLKTAWDSCVKTIEYVSTELDVDQDGLPENENFPDQTFDNWLMKGSSAYCSILRLAALQAAVQIADILEERERSKEWRLLLKKAKDSLDKKLWNGSYYKFDQKSEDVMAAQLMGQWYLDQMHLPGVLPKENILSAFRKIYQTNFKSFVKGKKGVVNGRTLDKQDVSCSQGNDVWVGINFALAAHMLVFGLQKEALAIIRSVTDIIYSRGFLFRTPESWDANDQFMATMYLRAGSIWSLADVPWGKQ